MCWPECHLLSCRLMDFNRQQNSQDKMECKLGNKYISYFFPNHAFPFLPLLFTSTKSLFIFPLVNHMFLFCFSLHNNSFYSPSFCLWLCFNSNLSSSCVFQWAIPLNYKCKVIKKPNQIQTKQRNKKPPFLKLNKGIDM